MFLTYLFRTLAEIAATHIKNKDFSHRHKYFTTSFHITCCSHSIYAMKTRITHSFMFISNTGKHKNLMSNKTCS